MVLVDGLGHRHPEGVLEACEAEVEVLARLKYKNEQHQRDLRHPGTQVGRVQAGFSSGAEYKQPQNYHSTEGWGPEGTPDAPILTLVEQHFPDFLPRQINLFLVILVEAASYYVDSGALFITNHSLPQPESANK